MQGVSLWRKKTKFAAMMPGLRSAACLWSMKCRSHLVVVYQFIHSSWSQCRAYCVCQSHTSIYIAHKLWSALARVCALLEEDDLRLLHTADRPNQDPRIGERSGTRFTQSPDRTMPIIGFIMAAFREPTTTGEVQRWPAAVSTASCTAVSAHRHNYT